MSPTVIKSSSAIQKVLLGGMFLLKTILLICFPEVCLLLLLNLLHFGGMVHRGYANLCNLPSRSIECNIEAKQRLVNIIHSLEDSDI